MLYQSVQRPCVGQQDGRREFRVAVQFHGELHDVPGSRPGFAAAENHSAVGHSAVFLREFLFADKGNRGVIADEIVGHLFDRPFNGGRIGAGFDDDVTVPGMKPVTRLVDDFPVANILDERFLRQSVLHGLLHARHATDGVGMSLAYAGAPERFIRPVRQHGISQQPQQGKQAGIPTHRDQRRRSGLPRHPVHRLEMFGNPGVGVKTVHCVKPLGQQRPLRDEIGGGAAAQDHHIDFIGVLFGIGQGNAGSAACRARQLPAGKDPDQLHVRVLPDRQFRPLAKITVAHDSNSDFTIHCNSPFCIEVLRLSLQMNYKNPTRVSFILFTPASTSLPR